MNSFRAIFVNEIMVLEICNYHPIILSSIFSYGMQPINFILSYLSICDNFTGLVEFMPAAVLGYYCWRSHQPQSTFDALKSHHNIVSIQTLATFSLLLWSLRLGSFLIYRMRKRPAVDSRLGEGKDRRKIEIQCLRFCNFG